MLIVLFCIFLHVICVHAPALAKDAATREKAPTESVASVLAVCMFEANALRACFCFATSLLLWFQLTSRKKHANKIQATDLLHTIIPNQGRIHGGRLGRSPLLKLTKVTLFAMILYNSENSIRDIRPFRRPLFCRSSVVEVFNTSLTVVNP